jgi:hypothetical protein
VQALAEELDQALCSTSRQEDAELYPFELLTVGRNPAHSEERPTDFAAGRGWKKRWAAANLKRVRRQSQIRAQFPSKTKKSFNISQKHGHMEETLPRV